MDTGASEVWCIASKKKKYIISPISVIKFSGEKERESRVLVNGYLLELQLNFNIKWKQILSIVSIILNQATECKFRVTAERS